MGQPADRGSVESTDDASTWRQTDVRLPRGGEPLDRYINTGDYRNAVGPGHLQAIAMADAPQDLPPYLRQLWRTDDEMTFRRVPLPWKQLAFGGMAFASDGALLLAEKKGPRGLCTGGVCHPGRIWRLPPGASEMKPLTDAPRLSGPFGMDTLEPSGGMIVARTGRRAIAISEDGYTWTKVSPGRQEATTERHPEDDPAVEARPRARVASAASGSPSAAARRHTLRACGQIRMQQRTLSAA